MSYLLGFRRTGLVDNKLSVADNPQKGGVWRYDFDAAGDRIPEVDLSTAIANSGASGLIRLFPGTYSLTTMETLADIGLTIEGESPESTIITSSITNSTAFFVNAANITFRNVTIIHTGGGTASGCFQVNANNFTLDNVKVEKTSGAPTTAYGVWIYAGTGHRFYSGTKITCTSGTSKYGVYNSLATITLTVEGVSVQGDTFDIFGDQTGSTVTLNNVVLTNGLVSFSGILNWLPEAKIVKNLLYHSLTHNIWPGGATFNDIADDTYAAGVWNVLHNGQAPDISRQAGGTSDPFSHYFRCTFDSAASQCGIVQFLDAQDTIPLRGQVVSLSFEAWGTNVAELRAAVLSWGSTADALTSDVVGTWSTNNPTLATNWTYANTPAADIIITGTRTRYTVNNILIPTTANNIALFIWASEEEASGDLFNIADVQLERGLVATKFVAALESEEIIRVSQFINSSYELGTAFGTAGLTGAFEWQTRVAIAASTAGNLRQSIVFPVVMRSTPTMTVYSPEGGTSGAIRNRTSGLDRTGVTATTVGRRGFLEFSVSNASANVIALDDIISFYFVADSRL